MTGIAYKNHIPEALLEWHGFAIIIKSADWYGIDCYFDHITDVIPVTELDDYLRRHNLTLRILD